MKSLGIQRRILLYVGVALALLLAGFALLGINAVRQSTDMVYEERLNTAYVVAGIMNQDILRVAEDVNQLSADTSGNGLEATQSGADRLLAHLAGTGTSTFFNVTGVWLLDSQGNLLASAGTPAPQANAAGPILAGIGNVPPGGYAMLPAQPGDGPTVPFAIILVRPESQGGPVSYVAVQTTGKNSQSPYVPSSAARESASVPGPLAAYHLEVITPTGMRVLGIGPDEQVGVISYHYAVLKDTMADGDGTVALHKPLAGQTFRPHVMAAVPLGASGFYLVMEQEADVALSLPMRLQWEVAALAAVGMASIAFIAWGTTRRVAVPIRQLNAAAQVMARGDLSNPIEIGAQDEVAELASGLDAMRRALLSASRRLAEVNSELEAKVNERTARLNEVLQKVLSAQEDERRRLARELHDEQGQALGAVSISLDRLSRLLGGASTQVKAELEEARNMTSALLQETRRLIYDLRPSVLDDMGLEAAIRWSAETHLARTGMEVSVSASLTQGHLAAAIETAVFRVVQEAIVNIERHAGAQHAAIALEEREGSLTVKVWDDGRGFDAAFVESHPESSGVGIEGMRERVRLIGGTLDIVSAPGKGTALTVKVPLDRGDAGGRKDDQDSPGG